jgi:hypothetical protein
MAFRIDASSTLRPVRRMADGRVHVDAFITRAGIFEYLNPDGSIRRELRAPEEVFDPTSMRSFQMLPVTNNHPPGLLSAADAKKYMVGMTGENVSRDDERIRTSLMVADENTIKEMEAGKIQVSCGYNCKIDATPGTHPIYGKYDVRQTDIRGNHVAIVDKGRAGDASIRMDSDTAVQREDNVLNAKERHALTSKEFAVPEREGLPIEDEGHLRAAMARFGQYQFQSSSEKKAAYGRIVKKAKVLGVDSSGFEQEWSGRLDSLAYSMPVAKVKETMADNKELIEAATAQFAQATARADEAEKSLAAEKARADAAEGAVAMLKAQLEAAQAGPKPADIEQRDAQIHGLQKLVAAEKARADEAESPERRRAAVKQRVALETAAAAVMGTARLDTFNDRELMDLVIEKLLGKKIEAERSDDYVRACFDTAINGYFGSKDALARLREVVQPKDVAPRADAASARQKMIERNSNAWKQENK